MVVSAALTQARGLEVQDALYGWKRKGLKQSPCAAVEMILLSGDVHVLLRQMKNCLRMMELSDAIQPNDGKVNEMMAELRKRIDEVEHFPSVE